MSQELTRESRLAARYLTDYIIYLHPFYFLVPWGETSFGAFKALNVLTIVLCIAAVLDFLRFGAKKPSWKFLLLVTWFALAFSLGLTFDLIRNDPVKTGLSIAQIAADSAPFIDAFLVAYLIWNNGWKQENFDRLLGFVYWIAFAVALEAIAVFYMGLPTGTEKYSLDLNGAFHSVFIQRRSVSGRLGVILATLAVYFWLRHDRRHYLLGIPLGFLLVFSAHSRFTMLSLVIGLAFVATCFFWGKVPSHRNIFVKAAFVLSVAPVLVVATLYGVALWGDSVRTGYGDVSSIQRSFTLRAFDYSRALDIFASRWIFGGGPRQGYYYGFHEDTPSTVSRLIFGDIEKFDFHHGWAELDLFRENPLDGTRYSIHGLPVNILVDFGFLGLVILSALAWDGAMMARHAFRMSKMKGFSPSARQFIAVFGLCLATALSTASTQKFFPYWLFAVMLGFLFFMYRKTLSELLLMNIARAQRLATEEK